MNDKAAGRSSAAMLIGVSALVVGFFAGYVTGKGASPAAAPSQPNQAGSAQDAIGGSVPLPPIPEGPEGLEKRHAVQGTVLSVEGSTLMISVRIVEDPAKAPTEKTLRVMLTDATTLAKQVALNDEELAAAQKKFDADQAEFLKTPPSPTAQPPEPPQPFRAVAIKAADLKEGQFVAVRSAAPIGTSGSVEAESVTVINEKPTSTTEGATPFTGAVPAPDEPPPTP